MEGKATLTLTDAKSGRVVKKVTEHNLVTDAVKRILNPPVYAMLYSFNFPNFINNVMPASKLFSGIMLLGNTLSESGGVSRGVCETKNGHLVSVTERTGIRTENGTVVCDGGLTLSPEAPVSMNVWALHSDLFPRMETDFARWLDENLEKNPLKCEYFLPLVVSELIGEKKAAVKVLRSTDQWYGVTYREDKPVVVEAIARKTVDGLYPENLWA